MAASIVNRACAVALASGTVLIALWVGLTATGPAAFAPFGAFLRSPIGQLALLGYVWALCFHFLAGLRYLYLDSGRGLAPKPARQVSIGIFAGSVVLTAIVVAAAVAQRG